MTGLCLFAGVLRIRNGSIIWKKQAFIPLVIRLNGNLLFDGQLKLIRVNAMIENCVIIGELQDYASNRLADRGLPPLVIEGGQYPSQKSVENFFLTNVCLFQTSGILDFPTRFIQGVFRDETQIDFQLPSCGSCSRFVLIPSYQNVPKEGVRFMTGTTVQSLVLLPSKNFELQLSTGQNILAQNLIIGTGKIPSINASNSLQGMSVLKHILKISPQIVLLRCTAFPAVIQVCLTSILK